MTSRPFLCLYRSDSIHIAWLHCHWFTVISLTRTAFYLQSTGKYCRFCLCVMYSVPHTDATWHAFIPGYANCCGCACAVEGIACTIEKDVHIRHVTERHSTPSLIVSVFNTALTACWKADVNIPTNTDTWKSPLSKGGKLLSFCFCADSLQQPWPRAMP